jgi:hypothetical protein
VGFGEGAVQGAAAVTGGAEGDPLLGAAHVRLVEVVGADQTGNVGQIAKTSRLTGVGMLCLTLLFHLLRDERKNRVRTILFWLLQMPYIFVLLYFTTNVLS